MPPTCSRFSHLVEVLLIRKKDFVVIAYLRGIVGGAATTVCACYRFRHDERRGSHSEVQSALSVSVLFYSRNALSIFYFEVRSPARLVERLRLISVGAKHPRT